MKRNKPQSKFKYFENCKSLTPISKMRKMQSEPGLQQKSTSCKKRKTIKIKPMKFVKSTKPLSHTNCISLEIKGVFKNKLSAQTLPLFDMQSDFENVKNEIKILKHHI